MPRPAAHSQLSEIQRRGDFQISTTRTSPLCPQQLWLPPLSSGGNRGALDGAHSLALENLRTYCYLGLGHPYVIYPRLPESRLVTLLPCKMGEKRADSWYDKCVCFLSTVQLGLYVDLQTRNRQPQFRGSERVLGTGYPRAEAPVCLLSVCSLCAWDIPSPKETYTQSAYCQVKYVNAHKLSDR